MEPQASQFKRTLLIVLIVLYVLTVAAFSYANWAAAPGFTQWWNWLLNLPILSIPLVLLYGSIYVLTVAWREHSSLGQVSPRLARVIRWAPRAAAILLILFIGLFSLDVFALEASPLELLGGFLMHNIPSIALFVLLLIAWKRPAVGFVTFFIAATLFGFFFVRGIYALPNLLLFVLPILLIAGLFYADWQWLKPESIA